MSIVIEETYWYIAINRQYVIRHDTLGTLFIIFHHR